MKTHTKMMIAHLIYKIITFIGVRPNRVITREGIKYEVDIREGIDLSLFLMGSFQRHVSRSSYYELPDDATIIDVGANVGSVCLGFLIRYPKSRVYAIESSEYAMRKLKTNIELNPEIKSRIAPYRFYVSSCSSKESVREMSSSWPVDDFKRPARHPVHLGILMSENVETISLDDFVVSHIIKTLDFIKIDTDGHELKVLEGSTNVLRELRPVIVFEMMSCTLENSPNEFKYCEEILMDQGYVLFDAVQAMPVASEKIHDFVPKEGSTDILAIPREKLLKNNMAANN